MPLIALLACGGPVAEDTGALDTAAPVSDPLAGCVRTAEWTAGEAAWTCTAAYDGDGHTLAEQCALADGASERGWTWDEDGCATREDWEVVTADGERVGSAVAACDEHASVATRVVNETVTGAGGVESTQSTTVWVNAYDDDHRVSAAWSVYAAVNDDPVATGWWTWTWDGGRVATEEVGDDATGVVLAVVYAYDGDLVAGEAHDEGGDGSVDRSVAYAYACP